MSGHLRENCYPFQGMRLAFSKYQGLGNDFILFDVDECPAASELSPAQAVRLCYRNRGIGGDGVLLVSSEDGELSMRVINADGSLPEMCGNGLRCVALHLARRERVGSGSSEAFVVQTPAGPHGCRVVEPVLLGAPTARIEVEMRPATLSPERIPVEASGPLLDEPFELGGRTVHVTAVSMGNPHAVVFDAVGDDRLVLGPVLSQHPRFARGVNVGFAQQVGPDRIELAVLERGAGWTQACGTGACAAAVAAVETGRAPRDTPLRVDLPGGPLQVTVGAPETPVRMVGPARHVFDGTIDLP